jgi:hypothetical protein
MAPKDLKTCEALGPLQAELGQQAGRMVLRIMSATARAHGFKPILDRLFRMVTPNIDPNRLHAQYESHTDRPVLIFFDKADLLTAPIAAESSFLAEVFMYLMSEGLIVNHTVPTPKLTERLSLIRRITPHTQGQWAVALTG